MRERHLGAKPFIKQIHNLDDDLLLPWLDLYETAFPPRERILVSSILAGLKAAPGPEALELLAAVDEDGALAGMAMVSRFMGGAMSYLWYFAVAPERRSGGVGAWFYREILSRLDDSGCRALFLEVEMPELTTTAEARTLAERRIAFYRRLGARRLIGIDYLLKVGTHQQPLPMHLMVQMLVELTAQEVLVLAQGTFGTAVTVVGVPGLA